jgi:hypothetical protein
MSAGASVTTGSFNTLLGNNAGGSLSTGCANIQIGGQLSNGAWTPVFSLTNQSNRIAIGSACATNAYIQVAWTVVSDARDKTNVTALPIGLDFVNQMNPVSFQFKEDRENDVAHGPVRYGFLAQEVLELEGEKPVLIDNEDPEHLRMVNDHLNAILVNAIKELSAKNDDLAAQIAQLRGE